MGGSNCVGRPVSFKPNPGNIIEILNFKMKGHEQLNIITSNCFTSISLQNLHKWLSLVSHKVPSCSASTLHSFYYGATQLYSRELVPILFSFYLQIYIQ